MLFAIGGSVGQSPTIVQSSADVSVIEAVSPTPSLEAQITFNSILFPLEEVREHEFLPTPSPTPTNTPDPVFTYVAPLATPVNVAVPQATAVVVYAETNRNEALWRAVSIYFPEQPQKAYNVFMCESGGDPRAVSLNGLYWGVAQQDVLIHGYPPPDVFVQVAKAREIYISAGYSWWPWPVCSQR